MVSVGYRCIVDGDFNLPGVNWKHKRVPLGTSLKKQAKLLLSFMEELHLHQMVHIPTRNSRTLDLLFTDAPDLSNRVSSAPGLSDHGTVIVDHQLKAFINKKEPRSVSLYHKANWKEVKHWIHRYSFRNIRFIDYAWLVFCYVLCGYIIESWVDVLLGSEPPF